MMNKFEVKKFAKKKMPIWLGKKWDKLTIKGKREMIEDATELIYEESNRTEKDLKKIDNQIKEAAFFFLGILFGIVGGLVATIIHSFLLKYGLIYYLVVFLVFIILCIVLIKFIRNQISRTYQSNKILVELGKKAKKIIEE